MLLLIFGSIVVIVLVIGAIAGASKRRHQPFYPVEHEEELSAADRVFYHIHDDPE